MKYIKRLVAAFFFSALLLLTLASCSPSITLKPEDVIDVALHGTNGDGSISMTWNYKKLISEMRDAMGSKWDNDEDGLKYSVILDLGASYSANKRTGLSNGDVVTITLEYNKEEFSEYGINFSEDSFKYTVKGLKDSEEIAPAEKDDEATEQAEPIEIDPFEGLTLEFTGTSPFLSVYLNTDGLTDIVRSNINLRKVNTDPFATYKNGDTVTIEAKILEKSKSFKNGEYTLSETQKDFTIEGQPEFFSLETIKDYDMTKIDDILDLNAKERAESFYPAGKELYTYIFLSHDGGFGDAWTIDSVDVTPESTYLYINRDIVDKNNTNTYVRFYKVTLNMTKTTNSWNIDKIKDGYELGTQKSFDIYLAEYADRIAPKQNGDLNWDDIYYLYTLYEGYDANFKTVEELEQYWITNNPEWDYVKLN
jgi:hypothetical protein